VATTITMRHNPERLAWRILVTAFTVFLIIAGSILYGLYWYIFLSTNQLGVDLSASRGTASVVLPNTGEPIAVTNTRTDLEPDAVVRTDSSSQAIVDFHEPRTDTQIGSLVVFRDSEVILRQISGPRFSPNRQPYFVELEAVSGRSEIMLVEPADNHDSFALMHTPHGLIRMEEPGLYIVETSEDETRLTVRTGRARVQRNDDDSAVRVRENQYIVLKGDEDILQVATAEQSLLENPYLAEPTEDIWLFYNDREPPGEAETTEFQGRNAILIDRSTEKYPDVVLDHGQTGLVQNLDLDVSDYAYLSFRSTFYVEEQSLSTCGNQGSECPMMVRFSYLDEEGNEQIFIHGFYTQSDPSLNFPLACASCQSEHERVNAGTWYTYESGNLLTTWPADRHPVEITQVSFYASGHAYKVYVSEVDLLAAR